MKKNYSDLLKSPKWQKKRLEIMKRDKFRCKLCGDTETSLQVHHKEYINGNAPWEYENSNFITLCEHCHYEVGILKKGEIEICDIISIIKGYSKGTRLIVVVFAERSLFRNYYETGELINSMWVHYNLLHEITSKMGKPIKKQHGKKTN